ncbi:hypothetical protein FRC06_003562 [Ceratobasidium sp. 370]|nr:hypothetical protein FRC06_003562 [Ceratobasidium sp. 370]
MGIMMQQQFLGMFCMHVYDYWRIFPTDTVLNRMTLLTLHGTMDFIDLYRNAVKYYVVFDKFDNQDCKIIVLGDWCYGLARNRCLNRFLGYCYGVTKNKIVAGVVGAMIIASLAFGITSRKDLQEIISSPPTTSYESTRGHAQTTGSLPTGTGSVVTASYQQNVDDTGSHGHDIELGRRTIDTVRFAR